MDGMWGYSGCPNCGEPIAVRHGHMCKCKVDRLSITRPKPQYCPWCEESKAQAQDNAWYPEYIDWVVCNKCKAQEEAMLDECTD